MAKNYANLVERLKNRSNPDFVNESKLYSESYNEFIGKISYNNALEYVRRAMKGVSPEYTKRSQEAGEKVKEHLKNVLNNVTYEYQGSVMTNTHIMGNSDIDLLVISEKSYYYNRSKVSNYLGLVSSTIPVNLRQKERLENVLITADYSGDTLNDLRSNRVESEKKLMSTYDICNIDKPKAIEITNQNLNRDVDVVIASWHYTPEFLATRNDDFKKITVYDKDDHGTGRLESPFVSINRINERDKDVNGRLKKMIRFLKNVKIDSAIDDIPLTSFEINAICYGINPDSYRDLSFLELVETLMTQMSALCSNEDYRNKLMSVDGSENIFIGKDDKLRGLGVLLSEVGEIAKDVLSEVNNVKLLRA